MFTLTMQHSSLNDIEPNDFCTILGKYIAERNLNYTNQWNEGHLSDFVVQIKSCLQLSDDDSEYFDIICDRISLFPPSEYNLKWETTTNAYKDIKLLISSVEAMEKNGGDYPVCVINENAYYRINNFK